MRPAAPARCSIPEAPVDLRGLTQPRAAQTTSFVLPNWEGAGRLVMHGVPIVIGPLNYVDVFSGPVHTSTLMLAKPV
jgi:hypothetical protein